MQKVIFDYSKLRGRIREVTGTQKALAKSMGISATALSAKLTNKVHFDQAEIKCAATILGIEPEYVSAYFFAQKL